MNAATEILNILNDNKITEISDVDNYPSSRHSMSMDAVCDCEETWVEDIFKILRIEVKIKNFYNWKKVLIL